MWLLDASVVIHALRNDPHTLTPMIVVMAGREVRDPYKD